MDTRRLSSWQIRIFTVSWIAYAAIYFGRVNLAVALPAIQESFGWSKSQLGLIGTLFFWVYGIGQLINGYMGDRVSARKYVFIGLIITALTNILFGFASALIVMIILWAINGYFQSMLWGPIVKTLSYWFSHESRSRTAIAISTSMVAGYLLAWGLAGKILTVSSWQWAFRVPGISILAYSAVWLLFFRNHPRDVNLKSPNSEHRGGDAEKSSSAKMPLLIVFRKTRIWYVVIACLAQGVVKDGIGLWGPTFLMETHHLDLSSTVSLILFIPISNFGGMMLAGWLNKLLNNQEKTTTAIMFSVGIIMILGLIFLGDTSKATSILFLSLSSAMMYGSNTLLLGVIPLTYAKFGKVSSVAGFLDFTSYLAAGAAAALTGLIVDLKNWRWVLMFWCVSAAVGAVSLLISRKR